MMSLYESQESPSVACNSCILRTTKPACFLNQPGKHIVMAMVGKDDQPGDKPSEAGVDDMSLHPCPGPLHPCSSSSRLAKVVRVAHWAHQLCCLWVMVSRSGLASVSDAGGEGVGELGAEAEVGVEEAEEEVEGAMVDEMGDKPATKISFPVLKLTRAGWVVQVVRTT